MSIPEMSKRRFSQSVYKMLKRVGWSKERVWDYKKHLVGEYEMVRLTPTMIPNRSFLTHFSWLTTYSWVLAACSWCYFSSEDCTVNGFPF